MMETLSIIQADNCARLTAQTFGHLAPKADNEYIGWVLFTLTAFGDTCLIDFEFDNLSESPWFNLDLVQYCADYTDSLSKEKQFGVFKWNGKYRKFKNGSSTFTGKFKEIECQ